MAKRKELGRRDPATRRQAIMDAALAVFAAQGFVATKLDDVAEKAGVAKGTIYLHFKDKETLFEEIVRAAVAPVIARLESVVQLPDLPTEMVLGTMFELLRTPVLGTDRKLVLRLVLTEGPRFPRIAEFYHREVISRGMRLIGGLLRRAASRGELASPGIAEYPQLVIAPLLLAVVWDSMFARIEPLDFESLFAVHRSALLAGSRTGGTP